MINTMMRIAKHSRFTCLGVILLCIGLNSGCARLQLFGAPKPTPEQTPATSSSHPASSTNTTGPVSGTEQISSAGNGSTAKAWEEIIARPPQSGVTDEALFRLALHNLRGNSREGSAKAQHLLNRLAKEYPQSSWNLWGQSINDLLDTLNDQRRLISNLRNQNQTLSKETKELHQTIERLKSLDLELEKKNRR